MKDSYEIIPLIVAMVIGVLVIVFGVGVAYGREEYKAELHKQVEENNRLLKENIALRAVKEQSK